MSRRHLKIALGLLLTLTVVVGVGFLRAATVPAGEVKLCIDGVQVFFPDQLPYIDENGRTLVPARFCSLALGASVSWDDEEQRVSISRPATPTAPARQVTLKIGSTQAAVSGETPEQLDTAAVLSNGRTMVPLRFISEFFAARVVWDTPSRTVHVFTQGQTPGEQKDIIRKTAAAGSDLPFLNSAQNLQGLLDEYQQNEATGDYVYKQAGPLRGLGMDQSTKASKTQAGTLNAAQRDDYSTTNVQLAGVDESDIVKTDGEYLYQIKEHEVIIVKAHPPEGIQLTARIPLTTPPQEMYIDHNRLIIIQAGNGYDTQASIYRGPGEAIADIYQPPPYHTSIAVFDTSDKNRPVEIDRYKTPGNYLSSRKIGNNIYIISTEGVYQPFEPVYSINGHEYTKPYDKIRYFPDMLLNTYMNIASIRLSQSGNLFSLETFLGSGHNVFCSEANLYIAASHYHPGHYNDKQLTGAESTLLYKFALGDQLSFISRGEVAGRILNQFSMDEYDGHFRIATTRDRRGMSNPTNAVYILDHHLRQINAIEDIAPGERIYSARFMGPRAYLVTFREVDPLFVIDLNPDDPKILGKLKIPGFSNYLHPYKEHYLIGLGNEVEDTGKSSRITGLKLSLFDVADVSRPIEVDKVVIGDEGTYTEAADNHKAFMMYQDILAFPATVYGGQPGHLCFAFQGAYIYNVSPQGFSLQGRITHLDEQNYLKAGNYWGGGDRDVQRIVYIDNHLYTLSQGMIKVNHYGTLAELKQLQTD